jgi:hypothetical protein
LHLYEEHRFLNLVSGLESLHRSLVGDPKSDAFKEKMARILGDIQGDRDRAWPRKRTKNFGAPALEQRLIELLQPVPARVEAARLRAFCVSCAQVRNDLAHRGQSNQAPDRTNSIQNMAVRNSVLTRGF